MLGIWMFPVYRHFDAVMPMVSVYGGLLLLEDPTPRRHFYCGGLIGVLAFFGPNYALYGGLGFSALIGARTFILRSLVPLREMPALALGVATGLLPLLFFLVAVPGFADRFIDWLRFQAERGNIPRELPWPWGRSYLPLSILMLGWFSARTLFFLLVVVHGLGVVTALFTRPERLQTRAPFLATTLVGLPFIHAVFARGDYEHLSAAISPTMLAILAVPTAFGYGHRLLAAAATWTALGLLAVLGALAANKTLAQFRPGVEPVSLKRYAVGADYLRLRAGTENYLRRVRTLVGLRAPGREAIFVAPHLVTLYAVLGKQSPTWQLFMLRPESHDRQLQMIRDLEKHHVNLALILDGPIDEREDLAFRNTHAVVWEYLMREFDSVDDPALPPDHILLERRTSPPGPAASD
jgi:hypothetical protein